MHKKSTLVMRQTQIGIIRHTAPSTMTNRSRAILNTQFREVIVEEKRPLAQGAYGIGLRRCTHRQKSQQKNDFLLHNIFLFSTHITGSFGGNNRFHRLAFKSVFKVQIYNFFSNGTIFFRPEARRVCSQAADWEWIATYLRYTFAILPLTKVSVGIGQV